ncbi:MAG: GPW/gp25 family protein [Candidatus Competibacteraceae bacterium]
MSESLSKTFLGVGVGFPLSADANGALRSAAYEESVRQSIWIILSTTKGERVMRPDFGCDIHELVFDTVTASTSGQVVTAIRDALLRFEPRINVLDVQVGSGGDGEVLLISIDYEVRATNNAFNLVYPFYLDAGAGG